MNNFAKALSAFNDADSALRAHVMSTKVSAASMARQEQLERELAQAGDALEGELRAMMREEERTQVNAGPPAWHSRVVLPHGGVLGEP